MKTNATAPYYKGFRFPPERLFPDNRPLTPQSALYRVQECLTYLPHHSPALATPSVGDFDPPENLDGSPSFITNAF